MQPWACQSECCGRGRWRGRPCLGPSRSAGSWRLSPSQVSLQLPAGGRLAVGEAPPARPAGSGLWRLAAGGRGRHLLPSTSGGRGGGPAPRPAPRARRYLTALPPWPRGWGHGEAPCRSPFPQENRVKAASMVGARLCCTAWPCFGKHPALFPQNGSGLQL